VAEKVHFSQDGNLTLCNQSASSYINCVCDYKPDDFCQECVSNLARVKELENAINEFFDCDDLWVNGIYAGEAAKQLKRLVGRQSP